MRPNIPLRDRADSALRLRAPRSQIDLAELRGAEALHAPATLERQVPSGNHTDTPNPSRSPEPQPQVDLWPDDSEAALRKFYGEPCNVPRTPVRCPWPLVLSWDQNQTTSTISIHTKCAASLTRVLERIADEYTEAELIDMRMDQYGGSFNCRNKRRGTSLSTHAWAIAIDWDPNNNKLRWDSNRASMAGPEFSAWWAAWEDEGWCSLGRTANFDWMHVQAARYVRSG